MSDEERIPRLFCYSEAVDAWIPVPDHFDSIGIDLPFEDMEDREIVNVRFRRYDMTDAEFDAIPEE